MNYKKALILSGAVLTVLVAVALALRPVDAASNPNGAFNDLSVSGQSSLVGGVKISGVTFFNGTLVNSTTGRGGSDTPVTVGDNIRIDGTIFRSETGGEKALRFGDSLLPETSNAYSLGSESKKFRDGFFSGKLTVNEIEVENLVAHKTNFNASVGEIGEGSLSPNKISGVALIQSTVFGGDVSGVYSNLQIGSGKVGSTELADGSLTDADISASGAIAASKISGTALVQATVFGGDVSGGYNNLLIGSGKVGSTELEDGSLTNSDISASAGIAASKISGTALILTSTFGGDVSGLYNNLQLGANTVGSAEIASGAIMDSDISSSAGIAASKISGTALVLTSTFGGDVSGLYNNLQLGANTVGSIEIVNSSIMDADISSSAAISASKIADGSGSGLDADTVDGRNLGSEVGQINLSFPNTNPVIVLEAESGYPGEACQLIGTKVSSTAANFKLTNESGTHDFCDYWGFNKGVYFSGAVDAGQTTADLCTITANDHGCQVSFGFANGPSVADGFVDVWMLWANSSLRGHYFKNSNQY